jgi:hypothetical protein
MAKLSDEAKQKISVSRKKWLAENPDKHPWKRKDKKFSVPCQKVKDFLSAKRNSFCRRMAAII